MTIIFLCGCVEPGKDGVGDYSRRLAGELVKMGHKTGLIALNDHYISRSEWIEEEQDLVPVYRFRTDRAHDQWRTIEELIAKMNPEWLSLQYVSFSFQKRGLHWGLCSELLKIGQNRKWHMMFHELWIGLDKEASLKHKVLGLMQKNLMRSLVKRLNPKIIHTQTGIYQINLFRLGFRDVHRLPLFGNIPVIEQEKAVADRDIHFLRRRLDLLIFGSVHKGAPVEEFAEEVARFSAEAGIKTSLAFIGRCGEEQKTWEKVFSERNIPVRVFGEQEPEFISVILTKSTLGISTTPLAQIEKSGTVASMLEHKLPVMVVSRSWTPKSEVQVNFPPGVFKYDKGNFKSCSGKLVKGNYGHSLKTISSRFTASLSCSTEI